MATDRVGAAGRLDDPRAWSPGARALLHRDDALGEHPVGCPGAPRLLAADPLEADGSSAEGIPRWLTRSAVMRPIWATASMLRTTVTTFGCASTMPTGVS